MTAFNKVLEYLKETGIRLGRASYSNPSTRITKEDSEMRTALMAILDLIYSPLHQSLSTGTSHSPSSHLVLFMYLVSTIGLIY